jgi:hypothetical protein
VIRTVVIFVLFGVLPPASSPLNVQRCNTQCQDRKTDCIDRCDGDVPCEEACQEWATGCAEKCWAKDPRAPRGGEDNPGSDSDSPD